MADPRHQLGRAGELQACQYLKGRGWQCLGTNVRTPYGEVDLLFQDGETLVAIEVKTRRNLGGEVVKVQQLQRIGRALGFLALQRRHPGQLRIDLVIVSGQYCHHHQDVGSSLAA